MQTISLMNNLQKSCQARGIDPSIAKNTAEFACHAIAIEPVGALNGLNEDINGVIRILTDTAEAIGCTVDELLGRTETPNTKCHVGELLSETGMTASDLHKIAEDMISSRISHAIEQAIPDEKALRRRLDQMISNKLSGIAKSVIRERLDHAEINVASTVLFSSDEKTNSGEKQAKYTVAVPGGKLVAYASDDPEFPGIHIELAQDGIPYMLNLATVECNAEEATYITHVWGDADKEDTTHDIIHEHVGQYFKEEG